MSNQRQGDRPRPIIDVKNFFWLLGIFALFYALNIYIDQRVEKKINDPQVIQKIVAKVRPAIIFDLKGSIINDMGGMQYIEDIHVEVTDQHLCKIVVTPKAYMAQAPILTSMDEENQYLISIKRSLKFNWEYTLEVVVGVGIKESSHFRLEVLP